MIAKQKKNEANLLLALNGNKNNIKLRENNKEERIKNK